MKIYKTDSKNPKLLKHPLHIEYIPTENGRNSTLNVINKKVQVAC